MPTQANDGTRLADVSPDARSSNKTMELSAAASKAMRAGLALRSNGSPVPIARIVTPAITMQKGDGEGKQVT